MRTSGCCPVGDVAGDALGDAVPEPGYDAGRLTTTDAVMVDDVVELGLLAEAAGGCGWFRLAREDSRSGVGSLGGDRFGWARIWMSFSSSSCAVDSGVAPRWCFCITNSADY